VLATWLLGVFGFGLMLCASIRGLLPWSGQRVSLLRRGLRLSGRQRIVWSVCWALSYCALFVAINAYYDHYGRHPHELEIGLGFAAAGFLLVFLLPTAVHNARVPRRRR
jgi:hypothetical protein